jgi:hypothetical protein
LTSLAPGRDTFIHVNGTSTALSFACTLSNALVTLNVRDLGKHMSLPVKNGFASLADTVHLVGNPTSMAQAFARRFK